MKILHCDTDDLSNPLHGGQPVRTFEVNRRLAGDHDLTIFTATYPGCQRRVEREALHYRRLGVTVPGFGLSPHLSFLACLGPAIRGTDHDLVVEEFTPPVGFCLLPWWTSRPVVSIVQWFFFKDWERRYKLPFERMMRAIAGRARYRNFIVQTERMGDAFRSLIPQARIWKVACGVNDEMFQSVDTQGDYALFLGRLDANHKGLDLLLDAWALLVKAGLRIPLHIAGSGPADDYLERRIENDGLSGVVRCIGRVDGEQKLQALRNCRFMVVPSRQETFGISALEAMASSRPVVAFDIDHLNEVLDRRWAELVKPLDVRSFADAVARLWADPERCREMGRQAHVAARARRWDELARQQDAVYRDIVSISNRRKA